VLLFEIKFLFNNLCTFCVFSIVSWCNVLWLVVDSFTFLSLSLASPPPTRTPSLLKLKHLFVCYWLDVVCYLPDENVRSGIA
jgi:hypothetical protein